jgi:hypothetical protein
LTTLIDYKIVPKASSISIPAFLFSHWLIFSMQCTFMGRLSEHFSGSHAAFGSTFRVTGGYQKAGTNFLKWVTGKIFTTSE